MELQIENELVASTCLSSARLFPQHRYVWSIYLSVCLSIHLCLPASIHLSIILPSINQAYLSARQFASCFEVMQEVCLYLVENAPVSVHSSIWRWSPSQLPLGKRQVQHGRVASSTQDQHTDTYCTAIHPSVCAVKEDEQRRHRTLYHSLNSGSILGSVPGLWPLNISLLLCPALDTLSNFFVTYFYKHEVKKRWS